MNSASGGKCDVQLAHRALSPRLTPRPEPRRTSASPSMQPISPLEQAAPARDRDRSGGPRRPQSLPHRGVAPATFGALRSCVHHSPRPGRPAFLCLRRRSIDGLALRAYLLTHPPTDSIHFNIASVSAHGPATGGFHNCSGRTIGPLCWVEFTATPIIKLRTRLPPVTPANARITP